MKIRIKTVAICGFLLSFLILACLSTNGAERFPRPDFDTGYHVPSPSQPQAPPSFLHWIDLLALAIALVLSAKFAIFDRSRKKVFILMIFSLIYFGFVKKGCICSVGSIQNLALAVFSPSYAIPFDVILLFALPIAFALFFGRVFCSSVCPLGAIQDIVVLKPLKLPLSIRELLGIVPYIYLGIVVLYAATASGFLICRGDHFVSFFRMSGAFEAILAGTIFLAAGIFIARPYCRFFCPYGVLLSWMSVFSKWRLHITPEKCVRCGLCMNNCPFEAIRAPTAEKYPDDRKKGTRRLALLIALFPVFMIIGIISGYSLGPALSGLNPVISLSRTIKEENISGTKEYSQASFAFRRTGIPLEKLYEEAGTIERRFVAGASILGVFIALAIFAKILRLSIWRRRKYFEPDPAQCLNCARCQNFCPVHRKNLQKKEQQGK